MRVQGPKSGNGNLHVAQVVAICSRHHTEISLVADYSSSLSFWWAVTPC